MTGYRITMWRSRAGDLWELLPHSGGWSSDGSCDVYDTLDGLRAAEGPLTAVEVDDVEALLRERDRLAAQLRRLGAAALEARKRRE